jgi:hypothetical protein
MIEKLGVYVVFVSGGLAWASDYFSIPQLATVALLLFGLWVVAWGVEVAVKGEVTLVNRERRRYEFFSGIPAGLWSAIFITTGIGILFLGWLDFSLPGGSEGFFDRVLNTPSGWGVLIGVAGLIVTASGVIHVISGSASVSEKVGRLEEFGYRAGGLLRTLIGSGMLILAAGLLIAPNLLKSLFDGMVKILEKWLVG